MRLIDADKLRLSYWIPSGTSTVSTAGQYYFYSRAEIDEAPTVDAEPIQHGHWIENGKYWYVCSVCGYVEPLSDLMDVHYKYCPRCGAKMDEEVEE